MGKYVGKWRVCSVQVVRRAYGWVITEEPCSCSTAEHQLHPHNEHNRATKTTTTTLNSDWKDQQTQKKSKARGGGGGGGGLRIPSEALDGRETWPDLQTDTAAINTQKTSWTHIEQETDRQSGRHTQTERQRNTGSQKPTQTRRDSDTQAYR